jgi:N,N'-diacetyllegionaminate synthase
MSDKQWMEVSRFAKSNRVKLIFDILGVKSLKVACKCGIKIIKLHSTDIYNYPLHDEIKKSSVRTVIISAGGCHKEEIVKVVKKLSNKKIIIIFGYQIYPTKSCNLNLSKILFLKNGVNFVRNVSFAYADHSPNGILETIYNCSSAISYGAEIIEKHFAFDKSIKTDSDKSAFNISQFNTMIKLINQCISIKKKHEWFHNDELIYRKNVSRNYFAIKNLRNINM